MGGRLESLLEVVGSRQEGVTTQMKELEIETERRRSLKKGSKAERSQVVRKTSQESISKILNRSRRMLKTKAHIPTKTKMRRGMNH